MIERCGALPESTPQNVVTARVKSLYNAYYDSVGVDIFVQKLNGKITAVFGGMDGSYSLLAFDNTDFDELNSYFSFLGATVFCFDSTAENLHPVITGISELYEFVAEVECVESDGHSKITDVYDALKKGEDGDIEMPPFGYWYTDFCVRFNHNVAEYALVDDAVAVAGFMTDFATLITGVATDKNRRKSGLGSCALRLLLSNIKKKHPSTRVFAATDNAAGFYIKNGFAKVGKVAVCKY